MSKDDIRFMVAVIGGPIVLVLGFVWIMAVPVSQASCDAATKGLRLQHEWSLMGGCRVLSAKDGWIPLENYRSF